MTLENQNKNHWDRLNINYSKAWQSQGKQAMSAREAAFIKYFLKKYCPKKILDIGVGTGRIINIHLVNTPPDSKIYGLDISNKMVQICRDKFRNKKKVLSIKVCDIAKEKINFDNNFDLITAIRVLKYNKNWPEILKKIYQKLNNNGILIFTMLNENSINRFFKYTIPLYRTNVKELKEILAKCGFEILEIRSFTKLPDFFYIHSKNNFLAKLVIFTEKLLEIIFGKVFLGRILFITVQKKTS